MSQYVPLTSTFRQPVRTLILILLVGMVSFAFVSKAVEYTVVQRETGRLGGYFRSIGSLDRVDKNTVGDVSQGANLVQNSPYLAYEDRRRYSTGVMEGVWNADVDHLTSDYSRKPAELLSGVHNSDMWFYGTLKEIDQKTSELGWYKLTFQIDKVLAGYPEDITSGMDLTLLFMLKGHEDAMPEIESMQVGQRYLIRGWWDWDVARPTLQIRPLDGEGLWCIPVENGAEVDLNSPSMIGIKNEIDILNENQHALLLTGTADMSALPQMQETSHLYYLVDGRWLNHQDDLDRQRVIVIQKSFADTRGLKLGDTISMALRGLQDPYWGYIRGIDRENWRSYPTYEERFEIVGIYDNSLGLDRAIYSTWAYIPNSVLPVNVAIPYDNLYPEAYSFVLDSSRHQEAFVNQYKEPLAQLGFNLTFVENNGAAFWAGFAPLRRSALSGLFVYSLVLFLVLALATFLYLSQRRKDYAILRALGVSKQQAYWQVVLPLPFLGAVGVIVGAIPAWFNTLANTAKTFSSLPTPAGVAPSTTLSPLIFATFCAGLLLLIFGFVWGGVRILGKKPVLELLGRAAPAGEARRSLKRTWPTPPDLQQGPSAAATVMLERHLLNGTAIVSDATEHHLKPEALARPVHGMALNGVLARFGFRHLERNRLKSPLMTLVALGLVFGLGWMQWMMEKNRAEVDHLYHTTIVEGEILKANSGLSTSGAGIIASGTVEQLLASGYIRSATLEATARITKLIPHANLELTQKVDFSLLAFDQPKAFFSTLVTRDTVQYSAGWDESLFEKDWNLEILGQKEVPAVFPENLLNLFNLKLGDGVVMEEESGTVYPYLVVGQYTPGARRYSENIVRMEGEPILVPLLALRVVQGKNLFYSTAKFVIDPAKNRDLPKFKDDLIKLVSRQGAGRLPLKIHFWDEELRSVVAPMEKNLSLLEVLYPVTIAVSVLIGAGLCLLLALLQARDTALLRMLGVTKTRVRALLSSEQMLLSLLGVLLGLGLLGIQQQSPGQILAKPELISAGLYMLGALIGSLIGAVLVSNRKPLDLLQVKE